MESISIKRILYILFFIFILILGFIAWFHPDLGWDNVVK